MLAGRKIIVDSYGGWGAHGGGAFSGKDWSKVDRSGAYAGRWIAKSLVAAGLARRVLVQLSYAIGVAEPLSIHVDSYGTGSKPDTELVSIIEKNWDLRPGVIGMSRATLIIISYKLTYWHLQFVTSVSSVLSTLRPLRTVTSATPPTLGKRESDLCAIEWQHRADALLLSKAPRSSSSKLLAEPSRA